MSTNTSWSCSFGSHPVREDKQRLYGWLYVCIGAHKVWVVILMISALEDKHTSCEGRVWGISDSKCGCFLTVNFKVEVELAFSFMSPPLILSIQGHQVHAAAKHSPPTLPPSPCLAPASVHPCVGLPICLSGFHFSKCKSSRLMPQLFWTLKDLWSIWVCERETLQIGSEARD